MEVRTELITDLREKFFRKLEDDGPPDSSEYMHFHFTKLIFSFHLIEILIRQENKI